MEGELIRASSPEEALAMKNNESAFFAGGTGIGYKDSGLKANRWILIPEISGIREIKTEDGLIRIGAMVSFTQALEDSVIPFYLKEALRFCGSLQKRNQATVGGNIASRRCDSYLIPALLASGARICLLDKEGTQTIGIEQYVDEPDRYRDALITAVCVKPDSAVSILSKRYANTVESHAYLTLSMGREGDDYRIGLAIKGSGLFHPDIMNWGIAWKKADVQDDMFGSEEYKRYLTQVTLETMYEKLGGEGGSAS